MPFPFTRSRHESDDPEAPRSFKGFLLELLQIFAITLVIIVPVRYFLIQPFYVKGASMEPSFYDHEYLIIDELSYRLHDPARGEIVVFRYPNDPKQFFIKRIIGLPGETVEVNDGHIKVYNSKEPNGVVLDEEGYLDGNKTLGSRTELLKPGEYFLMGDNREYSLDSRFFGPVSRAAIVGRVWLRGYPIYRWKHFQAPSYKI